MTEKSISKNIFLATQSVDTLWKRTGTDELPCTIIFSVPNNHPRFKVISQYSLSVHQLSVFNFLTNDLVLVDDGVSNILKYNNVSIYETITASEARVKNINFLKTFVTKYKKKKIKRVTAVGGGIIVNVGAYIAEQLQKELILVPTTVIAMADAAIGGKVRINDVINNRCIKHAYKSFYEPRE